MTLTVLALAGLLLAAAPPKAGEAPRGESIYQMAARFVDQTGVPAGLDAGRGHPVLMSMFYASCRDACPLLIADIRRVEASLPARVRADLRVVLVTLDPSHDTPAALQALATAHGVDGARWRFLTGSDDAVREVAAVLGVKYRRLSTGVINHASIITLLDRAGVVDTRVEGLGQPPTDLVQRLLAIARAPRAHAKE
jgi:protein SCO1/2